MKALIAKLAIVMIFASGYATAAVVPATEAAQGVAPQTQAQHYAGDTEHGDYGYGGCNKNKWEDT